MSVKNKLNRLKKHVIREENEQEQKSIEPINPGEEKWKEHQISFFSFDSQTCLVREVTYPLNFQHGNYQLGEFHRIVSMWNQIKSNHPLSSKGHKADELFFFDTETTGLGGGTGNTIFLLGQAQVFEDKVIIKQHLLPKPGNEVALYQSFLKGINSKTLVTYNGKSFDWPQVKTRHTLIRDSVPSLPPFGHFDLFHAAKRLWRGDLESLRLSVVETEVLGIKRENDVPGYLAPMLYFQFVKQQEPEIIMGVLKHNEIDVLSLITLYIHLSYKLINTEKEASASEHFQIARWLDYVGEQSAAFKAYQTLIETKPLHDSEAKFNLAQHYKKNREWKKAVHIWEELADLNKNVVTVKKGLIELAKYYEHKEKSYQLALNYSERAFKITQENPKTSYKDGIELEKRISRLKKKISKNIAWASAENE